MEKLPEVVMAKALMTEAMTWSVMRWLREKKRVRKTADQANLALDQMSAAVKQQWSGELRAEYECLINRGADSAIRNCQKRLSPPNAPGALLTAKKIKEADDEAYRARMDAEDTFDEAEKQLSTRLAREGCGKAIHAWDLQEKAILKALTVVHVK